MTRVADRSSFSPDIAASDPVSLNTPANSAGENRIWIEIDDFARAMEWAITPTGIRRVQSEIFPHLMSAFSDRVAFFRIGLSADNLRDVPAESLRRMIDASGDHGADNSRRLIATRLRQTRHFVADRIREKFANSLLKARNDSFFCDNVKPGDFILNIGSSWEHRKFASSIRELKRRHGVKFAILVHDILPVTFPEYVSPPHIPAFKRWLSEMATCWDHVLTPSHYSADALRAFLQESGFPVPPVEPVTFGAGIRAPDAARDADKIIDEPFVLSVSTIEVRKNHILLVNVWKRLIERHGADKVPLLVFAGRFGWEIDPLRAAIAETNWLGGRLRIVENMSDRQLERTYRDCLFTAFPSYCEGYGLPVSESLTHGKLCIASNATSIPEVGGPFADYFAPDDAESAFQLIERAIFDRDYRISRERDIAARYERPSWDDTASQIVGILGAPRRGSPRKPSAG